MINTVTTTSLPISPKQANGWLNAGRKAYRLQRNKHCQDWRKRAKRITAEMRARYGFAPVDADLLTEPSGNLKLAKGSVPSYGLSLNHYVIKLTNGEVWNLCPKAGDCTKLCVSRNGKGGTDHAEQARKWKTELLLTEPETFFFKLGWEIERAIQKHGRILLRPNTFSDIEWEKVCPALVDGSIFGDAVKFYGYTKNLDVLTTDGWITPHYRVAYSLNENSDPYAVEDFLWRGGSVAVVTDRYYTSRTRQAVEQWDPRFRTVDADASDEWIFERGVIGDLAYKPRTSKLRAWGQQTNFVVKVYGMGGKMATLADARLAADVATMVTPVAIKADRELVAL